MLKKALIVTLFFTGVAFPQTEEEQTKILLAGYVIQLNRTVRLNTNLTESINAIVTDLQAIENTSEELIAILKKYNIYKGDNGNIPNKD